MGKSCCDIAHDNKFRGMFVEINKLGLGRKRQLAGDIECVKKFEYNTKQLLTLTNIQHTMEKDMRKKKTHQIKKTTVVFNYHRKDEN